jgi:hypothetical protein
MFIRPVRTKKQKKAIPLAGGDADGALSELLHLGRTTWDRCVIVRGYWVRNIGWWRWSGSTTVGSSSRWNAAGFGGMSVPAADDGRARPRCEGAHVGRPAVGRTSRDRALPAASPLVPALRHSHGTRRLCRTACPADAALPATDRLGLSVDADQSRRRAPCRELGTGAPGGTRVSRDVGSDATETPAPTPRR